MPKMSAYSGSLRRKPARSLRTETTTRDSNSFAHDTLRNVAASYTIHEAYRVQPLKLQTTNIFTRNELKIWASVSDNTLSKLVDQVSLRQLHVGSRRRFLMLDVFRSLLGLVPQDPADIALLMKPLQTSKWVADVTGISLSALSRHARGTTTIELFPAPLQLSQGGSTEPRGRRWIAASIEAWLAGQPDPCIAMSVAAFDPCNVFGQIASRNGSVTTTLRNNSHRNERS